MSYHNEIMNIQMDNSQYEDMMVNERMAYKLGHRDARHAAAEIALSADSRIEELESIIRDALRELQWIDENHKGNSKLYKIRNWYSDESLFWQEDQGWVDEDTATVYTEQNRNDLNPPMHGEWVRIQ